MRNIAKDLRFLDEPLQGFDRVVVSALLAEVRDVQHKLARGLAVGHLAGKFDFVFDRFVIAVFFSPVEGKNFVRNVAVNEIGVAAPIEVITEEKRFPGFLIVFGGEAIGVSFAGVDEAGGAIFRHRRFLLRD